MLQVFPENLKSGSFGATSTYPRPNAGNIAMGDTCTKQNNHKIKNKRRRREGWFIYLLSYVSYFYREVSIEERYTLLRKESNGQLQSNKLRKEIIIFNIFLLIKKKTLRKQIKEYQIIMFNMFSLLAGFGADEKLVHTLSNNLTSLWKHYSDA